MNTVQDPYTERTDDELVQLCQEQLPYRSEAFEVLIRRYEPQVFQACRNYLGSVHEAEEAAQDVLMRVFRGLQRFKGDSALKTWIYRIAMNVCATIYAKRKEEIRRRDLIKEARLERDNIYEQESELEAQELGGPVGNAMKALGEDDRQILVLRHTAELSFEELAETLGLKLSAAKMRLYRAEERFRECYAKALAEAPEEKPESV